MLRLENVSKHYKNRFEAVNGEVLDNVTLKVDTGDFVSIVGPSGCGKTTLINIIMGLIKPSSGEVFIDDRKVTGVGDDRAMVFQENALFPWLSVVQNVELGLKVKGLKPKYRREISEKYLRITNLCGFENARIHELSGGMKQRVAIARALAIESQILVMDEPFGALDPSTKNTLHEELLKIWKDTGKTIIFITHDVEEAVLLSTKIVVLGFAPDNIKEEMSIPLEYPRKESEEVAEYVKKIKDVIARSSRQ